MVLIDTRLAENPAADDAQIWDEYCELREDEAAALWARDYDQEPSWWHRPWAQQPTDDRAADYEADRFASKMFGRV